MNRYLVEYTRDREHFEREIVEAKDFTKAYLEFVYAHDIECEITELILIERKVEDEKAGNGY